MIRHPMDDLGAMGLDPVEFSAGLLKHDLWDIEKRILRSIAANERTAVKACHSSGKTFTASDAVIWWCCRYDNGQVVTTAPTWTQVEKQLWGRIHGALAGASLGGMPKINKTEIPLGPENFAIGLSTNEGVRFQGWHGQMLIVLDEGPGVIPEIWDAIEGIRAGGDVHVLALGQPMLLGGPFYDAFHEQSSSWHTITISAFDTPNLMGCCLDTGKLRYGDPHPHAKNLLRMSKHELQHNVRPYLTKRSWVLEKWEEWGAKGSPMWEIKVLGEFPDQSEFTLIPLAWLDRAEARKMGGVDPLVGGLDVAGPGDAATVLKLRDDRNVVHENRWLNADPRGDVLADLLPFRDRLAIVNVDTIGIGYYFARHLEDNGIPVRDVNVDSTEGVDTTRYANLKAESFWSLRERFERDELGGLSDRETKAQLSTLGYHHDHRGRVVIESKDELRDRGLKSPDDAEALMLTCVPPIAPPLPRRRGIGSATYSSV